MVVLEPIYLVGSLRAGPVGRISYNMYTSIMNKLMCKTSNSKISDGLTAEAFSRFFAQKVEAVRAATAAADPPVFTSCPKPCTFESFKPLSQDQILFLIRRAPDKTSELDPISTWLVRECAEILAPFFAHVFNASLLEGYLPADQKRAIIYPGLKKPSLDPDDMASYRPISNFNFTSKLLERAVHAQLLIYLNENELLPSVQSAYRQFFSTETAVLKVVTDVLTAMDRRQITLLGMFDLSAAFDTVDHAILLRRLEVSFGIRGVALNWFASYLSGRSQQVSVHGTLALSTFLEYECLRVLCSGRFSFSCILQTLLAWCAPLVCVHMHMQMIFRFTATFLLGRNTLHCNALGVAQILLVDGCLLIG